MGNKTPVYGMENVTPSLSSAMKLKINDAILASLYLNEPVEIQFASKEQAASAMGYIAIMYTHYKQALDALLNLPYIRQELPVPVEPSVDKLDEIHTMGRKVLFEGDENEELFEQVFGEKEAVLFGEGYGPKIQNGGAYRNDVSFILFDVWIGKKYLEQAAVTDIARTFHIDRVPTIFTGTIDEAVRFVKSRPKSTIGSADMEGLVGRPGVELMDGNGKRIIVKIKVKDFECGAGKRKKAET